MRLARHVGHMGEAQMLATNWLESLKERGHSADLGVDGRTILKWILNKVVGYELYSSGSGQGLEAGFCETVMNLGVR
jgi:hypothetical protein